MIEAVAISQQRKRFHSQSTLIDLSYWDPHQDPQPLQLMKERVSDLLFTWFKHLPLRDEGLWNPLCLVQIDSQSVSSPWLACLPACWGFVTTPPGFVCLIIFMVIEYKHALWCTATRGNSIWLWACISYSQGMGGGLGGEAGRKGLPPPCFALWYCNQLLSPWASC